MCDPLTIASLAIGSAGTAANFIGKRKAEKEQKQEVSKWQQYQRRAREMEEERQSKFQEKSLDEVAKNTERLGGENQADVQAAEATRLGGELEQMSGATAPRAVADEAAMSGQQSGGDVFQSDMARSLSDATASAKKRIGAMAGLSAFGGSEGGLGTVLPISSALAAANVNQQNNYRAGSMSAFAAKEKVPPKQIEYSNPLADIAQSFLGAGLAGVGKAASGLPSLFGNAVALPATAPIPTPRPGVPGPIPWSMFS